MSKQANARRSKLNLLTTVSAFALSVSAYPATAGEPSTWIEFGWESQHVYNSHDSFALPIGGAVIPTGLSDASTASLSLTHSYGEFGKVTFQPEDSHWRFSASVTYGRSTGKRRGVIDQSQAIPTDSFVTYHESIPTHPSLSNYNFDRTRPVNVAANLIHVETVSSESHHMVDFEAGYDVGLGAFGERGISTIGVGIRFAQLRSALNIANFRAVAGIHFDHFQSTVPEYVFYGSGIALASLHRGGNTQNWSTTAGNGKSGHDFSGLGPSVYWEASTSLWGNPAHDGEISVDWGVGAALLFGKQKNKAEHQTFGSHYCFGEFCFGASSLYAGAIRATPFHNSGATRSEKRVTVPNLGGSIGLSYRFEDIKLSAGYRGDFFFRAIDTGIPGHHAITRGFQGPYASISVGLGD